MPLPKKPRGTHCHVQIVLLEELAEEEEVRLTGSHSDVYDFWDDTGENIYLAIDEPKDPRQVRFCCTIALVITAPESMITQVKLKNFRGFEDYNIPLTETTILVGKNNAGKSTAIEALRLVSLIVERFRSITYNTPPAWLDLPRITRGISPSLKNIEISFESLFHRLSEPPAVIEAQLGLDVSIVIYLGGSDQIYAVITGKDGIVRDKAEAKRVVVNPVKILPQVGPLQKVEKTLDPNYVRSAYSSALASQHFRNQILLNKNNVQKFAELVEASWPGIHVQALDSRDRERLSLLVRDGGFVAEVGWLGHGLQMWLQIMWFLANSTPEATIILDEPDVYMHVDQQRRILRVLRGAYHQIILSTHSAEILTEAEPSDVVIIDRTRKTAQAASSIPSLQKVIDDLGGTNNLQLMRIWSARKMLFVEGKDVPILRSAQRAILGELPDAIDLLPHLSYGGWGGWPYAIGSSMLLQNAAGEEVRRYCLMDRDYHTDAEIEQRLQEAKSKGIELHIWHRKEIENYFLLPAAIHKVITSECRRQKPPSLQDVIGQLECIALDLRESTTDALATGYHAVNRGATLGVANTHARTNISNAFDSFDGKLSVVSGKEVLGRLSQWSQLNYGVSLGVAKISRHAVARDFSTEFSAIVTAIDQGRTFDGIPAIAKPSRTETDRLQAS